MLLRQLKTLIAEARDNAMREAKRSSEFRFFRSRGISLVAVGPSGRIDPPNPRYGWDGTLREIREFAVEANKASATHIAFCGGIDGSDEFGFPDDYCPEIETFEVVIPLIETLG